MLEVKKILLRYFQRNGDRMKKMEKNGKKAPIFPMQRILHEKNGKTNKNDKSIIFWLQRYFARNVSIRNLASSRSTIHYAQR